MLQIYNSFTQQKEIFKPIEPGKVKLYVCGNTVYDYCHMGHARTMVAFDVIVRYLRARGFEVTYVSNITDIDDKIIKRAEENNEDFHAVTARFIAAQNEDKKALDVRLPDIEPRATGYMQEMIDLISDLIDKGYAYVGANGDVYYDVKKFKKYGELAHRDLEKLMAGARVEVNEGKHDALDFVLWKLAKPNDPFWPSPWGNGRPGWHIECSAMSIHCLGEHFDIHGGGFDLIFPHHENEIAQSEAATGKKFANVWMHIGFLQINKEKMSKSLNNFFTIRDVLAEFSGEVIRYFILSSHYRSPLNYSAESLVNAKASLERLYLAMREFDLAKNAKLDENNDFVKRFYHAMDDDFNTSDALAVLFDMAREINRLKESEPSQAAAIATNLKLLGNTLGILQHDSINDLQVLDNKLSAEKIEQLIVEREQARKAKDWQGADRIRDQLLDAGVILEDKGAQTSWRYK